MPGRYLDAQTLKDYVRSETVTDLPSYEAAILSAEEHVDTAHRRRFEVAVPGSPTARVFRPLQYSDVLYLDDFVGTPAPVIVENGTTLTAGTGYVLEPLNGRNEAGLTVPYHRAVRYNTSWYYDGPKALVTVTAAWGWATIPYLVVEACKVAAKAILEGRDVSFGLVALADSGGVSEREAKVIKDSIAAYERKPAAGSRSWGVA